MQLPPSLLSMLSCDWMSQAGGCAELSYELRSPGKGTDLFYCSFSLGLRGNLCLYFASMDYLILLNAIWESSPLHLLPVLQGVSLPRELTKGHSVKEHSVSPIFLQGGIKSLLWLGPYVTRYSAFFIPNNKSPNHKHKPPTSVSY